MVLLLLLFAVLVMYSCSLFVFLFCGMRLCPLLLVVFVVRALGVDAAIVLCSLLLVCVRDIAIRLRSSSVVLFRVLVIVLCSCSNYLFVL